MNRIHNHSTRMTNDSPTSANWKNTKVFLCFALAITLTTQLHALTLPSFLTDGNNEVQATIGFITGKPASGEVFRTDIYAQRATSLYSAALGMEFTDECFSLLLNGGIYWDATETFTLGATLVFNQLFLFNTMDEQNIVPSALCRIHFTENSKLEIELGMLHKIDRFTSLPSDQNRIYNLSTSFSLYYTYMFDRLSILAGLSSHTPYSYRLFMQPRWILGAEYTINDNFSASINADVQYGDVLLSAYIDSFSMDISCKYRF